MSGKVVVYFNVRRGYGVSYCQETVVYLNVRRDGGVS